jgi:hypothetical protein
MRNRWVVVLTALIAVAFASPAAMHAGEGAASPEILPSAESANGYIVITAPEADVVATPDDGAAVIGKAAKGTIFPLKGEQAGWYSVSAGKTVTGEAAVGWVRRRSAALIFYPEFLDPERLAESWSQPERTRIPYGAWGYPGDWGYGYPGSRAYGYPRRWGYGYRGWPRLWSGDLLWWGLGVHWGNRYWNEPHRYPGGHGPVQHGPVHQRPYGGGRR